MTVSFREATRADVPDVVALLRDDALGQGREIGDASSYLAAFDAMTREGANVQIVGVKDGRIVACYQITMISGLSLSAARRAQIEGVRVASDARGSGIGQALIADAERRARAGGCSLLQLTMNRSRTRSHDFYVREGFDPSHIGFKKSL